MNAKQFSEHLTINRELYEAGTINKAEYEKRVRIYQTHHTNCTIFQAISFLIGILIAIIWVLCAGCSNTQLIEKAATQTDYAVMVAFTHQLAKKRGIPYHQAIAAVKKYAKRKGITLPKNPKLVEQHKNTKSILNVHKIIPRANKAPFDHTNINHVQKKFGYTYQEAYTYAYRYRLLIATDRSLGNRSPTDNVEYYWKISQRYKHVLGERYWEAMQKADQNYVWKN